ncbi:MAG TPA: carboxypeptidase-like regulatory domain-containing protein [Candidatus Acidoferrales bacterium]|nr:carboxypeptidase-like regulatory domain-containing protein [Candidatus Acidoferrales bacterium]
MITSFKAIFFFSLSLVAFAAAASQQDDGPKVSTVNIVVVRDSNGKPVKNAEVILHLLDKEGNAKQDGLELKTHEDGKAATDGIPYGKVRIQVIAHGFRTWGNDYEVRQPNMEITIKLQKPGGQFSIYK